MTTPDLVVRLMRELGRVCQNPANVYFAGGVTAILHGWRGTTIAVDLKLVPESEEVLRALPQMKESLKLNAELASTCR